MTGRMTDAQLGVGIWQGRTTGTKRAAPARLKRPESSLIRTAPVHSASQPIMYSYNLHQRSANTRAIVMTFNSSRSCESPNGFLSASKWARTEKAPGTDIIRV